MPRLPAQDPESSTLPGEDFAASSPVSRRAFFRGSTSLLAASLAAPLVATDRADAQLKPQVLGAVRAIDVAARPITSFARDGSTARRYGRLEWRGGLVLSSSSSDFGGWSGMAFDPDGRTFVAVSDAGTWMTATLGYDGRVPTTVTKARMGPLLAKDGKPLARRRDRDAESIALLDGTLAAGSVLIAFEGNDRVGRFPVKGGVVGPPTGYLKMPPEARQMRVNGLEAVTLLRGGPRRGTVVAFAEEVLSGKSAHSGWMWIGDEPKSFALTDVGGYAVTDAAGLSDGSLIVLERRFRWTEGIRFRLRKVAAAELRPGAVIAGEVLIEADMTYDIDNMEALAVRETASGAVLITLMSDDNFSPFLQRTILLEFALPPEPKTTTAAP